MTLPVPPLDPASRPPAPADVPRQGIRRERLGNPGDLTDREVDVLRLIARGASNHEIGARLYLTLNTVKSHISSAYRQIGVSRRSQAIVWAFEHGLDRDLPATERPT